MTDAPSSEEALDASPRSVPGTSLVAYTDWRKSNRSAHTPSPLYDVRINAPGSPSRRVDGAGARSVNAFWPAVASANGVPYIAWQDMTRGTAEIWLARMSRSVRRVPVARAWRGNAWRPALAVSGSAALIAWEDVRDGLPQIYIRRMPLPF